MKLKRIIFWKIAVSAGLSFGAVIILFALLSSLAVDPILLFLVSMGAGLIYAYFECDRHYESIIKKPEHINSAEIKEETEQE